MQLALPHAIGALHLTANPPVQFQAVDGGFQLKQDHTGLLSTMGFESGITWVTEDPQAAMQRWFSEAESTVLLRSNSTEHTQTIHWEGAATPALALIRPGRRERRTVSIPPSTQVICHARRFSTWWWRGPQPTQRSRCSNGSQRRTGPEWWPLALCRQGRHHQSPAPSAISTVNAGIAKIAGGAPVAIAGK